VYVLLAGPASRDEPRDESELVAVLREQLAAERQAHAEARRIIAGLVERLPQALESPQASETVEGAQEGAEPRSDTVGPQERAQGRTGRPWWQFWR